MKSFFVTWSWYDHGHEMSHTVCRAIISAKQRVLAEIEAKSLIPQAIAIHNSTGAHPDDLIPADIEVSVKPLEEWIDQLKNNADLIRNVDVCPAEED